ncbi:hypothetical protein BALAC2494_02011 [Bifidobacterium animalis subsp. lactis CNCM I-2494]|uniref:Uncharacterized protein n=1 Tax=Bifidobacterium animalis subsp. lactis CNCM I-2494 TaxID=1042403 RepID=A0A806FUE7_BIFAN|nr:hypothetical protein BALAC2494_02011 [Bifidobacterium animalis subsp. lactis CNCM I-2494]
MSYFTYIKNQPFAAITFTNELTNGFFLHLIRI